MDVRRVQKDDWRALRDVRLAALADAPTAFGSTHAGALERPEAWWVEWCERSAATEGQSVVLAWDDTTPVGMAGVYRTEDGLWQVISMWVEPAARGRGIARTLLDAVVRFAREHGADEIVLGVTDGNDTARALYESFGFVDNGESEPLVSHPELAVRYLRLA